MESAWENSVMIGLRDVQRDGMGRLVADHPGYFAALEGDFEESAGDAILAVGPRYFLFELKGTLVDVRSEWARYYKDAVGDSVAKPKAVHLRLMTLVRSFLNNNQAMAAEASNVIDLSLRAHHFAYWNHERLDPPPEDILGELLTSPYITTSLARLAAAREDAIKVSGFLGKGNLEQMRVDLAESFRLRAILDASAKFSDVFAVRARDICEPFVKIRSPESDVLGLGLDESDFRIYLEFLQHGLSDEEMKAVIYSPQTGVFRYVSRLSKLVPTFESALQREKLDAVWAEVLPSPQPPFPPNKIGRRFRK